MQYFQGAIKLMQELQDVTGEAECTIHMGEVCAALGEHDYARSHLSKAIALARSLNDKKFGFSSQAIR